MPSGSSRGGQNPKCPAIEAEGLLPVPQPVVGFGDSEQDPVTGLARPQELPVIEESLGIAAPVVQVVSERGQRPLVVRIEIQEAAIELREVGGPSRPPEMAGQLEDPGGVGRVHPIGFPVVPEREVGAVEVGEPPGSPEQNRPVGRIGSDQGVDGPSGGSDTLFPDEGLGDQEIFGSVARGVFPDDAGQVSESRFPGGRIVQGEKMIHVARQVRGRVPGHDPEQDAFGRFGKIGVLELANGPQKVRPVFSGGERAGEEKGPRIAWLVVPAVESVEGLLGRAVSRKKGVGLPEELDGQGKIVPGLGIVGEETEGKEPVAAFAHPADQVGLGDSPLMVAQAQVQKPPPGVFRSVEAPPGDHFQGRPGLVEPSQLLGQPDFVVEVDPIFGSPPGQVPENGESQRPVPVAIEEPGDAFDRVVRRHVVFEPAIQKIALDGPIQVQEGADAFQKDRGKVAACVPGMPEKEDDASIISQRVLEGDQFPEIVLPVRFPAEEGGQRLSLVDEMAGRPVVADQLLPQGQVFRIGAEHAVIQADDRPAPVQEVVQSDRFVERAGGHGMLAREEGVVEEGLPGVVHAEIQPCQPEAFARVPRRLEEKLFKIGGRLLGVPAADFHRGPVGQGPCRRRFSCEIGFQETVGQVVFVGLDRQADILSPAWDKKQSKEAEGPEKEDDPDPTDLHGEGSIW